MSSSKNFQMKRSRNLKLSYNHSFNKFNSFVTKDLTKKKTRRKTIKTLSSGILNAKRLKWNTHSSNRE